MRHGCQGMLLNSSFIIHFNPNKRVLYECVETRLEVFGMCFFNFTSVSGANFHQSLPHIFPMGFLFHVRARIAISTPMFHFVHLRNTLCCGRRKYFPASPRRVWIISLGTFFWQYLSVDGDAYSIIVLQIWLTIFVCVVRFNMGFSKEQFDVLANPKAMAEEF